ncbi:protein ARMCX6 [Choloepus didactylus]|uniref:protein ARMCX6 n=1 Tax=Choloepus didactylus TaxID=27675 RepID=UPI00189C8517|nr:protein ARMCX6 [Choloepus didactylus]XP_037677504.1 protein ARMCX6 [Choloepus didactylus]XP_037677506.1 protein ARMCX6 [Choloepus didactylus]XP_037677507.1 protein ARMCX6 [Choloepus didactylus]XP_037677508.1 protein ARMCX6 [Choloepus didactylus]
MGRAREVGWMAAGLMIGAGACYCVYKLTIGRDDSDTLEEEEDKWDEDEELDEEEPELWFDFTTMAQPWNEDGDWTKPGAPGGSEDRPSGGGKANRTYLIKERPSPYGHKNTWSAQSFNNVSVVLDLSKCPFLQVKRLFAQARQAGFPSNHNINSHLASLPVVGNMIPTPGPTVKEKAVCALDNLNVSIENQGQIKMYISEVRRETVSHCRNSFLQQAGLNLLISMAVINNMLAKSVSDLKFPLISEGSGCAKVQVLKPLMGLSEKAALAGELFSAQMLFSFMSLFIRNGNRDVVLDVLAP